MPEHDETICEKIQKWNTLSNYFWAQCPKSFVWEITTPLPPPPAAAPVAPLPPPLLPMVLLAREEAIKRTELSNLKREVHLFFCCGITLRLLTIYPLLLSLSLSFTYKSKYCKNVTTVHDKMRFIQTKKYNKNYCYNSKHFQSLTLRPLGSPM